jgi:hypothetical protein
MRVIAAISSPAQDDLIEKILKALKLWDPPWKRQRSARGPSRSHATAQAALESWPEGADPPHPDDFADPRPRDDGDS